jgi:allantoin racemase
MSPPVKVLYLNVTQKTDAELAAFVDMVRRHKLPGTEVHIASLPDADGRFRNAEYRSYEAVMTRGVVRATRAAAPEGFALAIGCFYDIALHDAREISGDMIVSAPCEASCEIAVSLANRFGVIVGRRKWVHQMQATVHSYGYEHRLVGLYPIELGVTDFQKDHSETARRIIATGHKAPEDEIARFGCFPDGEALGPRAVVDAVSSSGQAIFASS